VPPKINLSASWEGTGPPLPPVDPPLEPVWSRDSAIFQSYQYAMHLLQLKEIVATHSSF